MPLRSPRRDGRVVSFTIADLIVETLEQTGVRRVCGLPGGSLNGFTDALRRNANQHGATSEEADAAAGRYMTEVKGVVV